VEVSAEQITLEEKAVRQRRRPCIARNAKSLWTESDLAAQREKPILITKGNVFQRIPEVIPLGLAGRSQESTWKPALVEIEEALVPAFIVEELEDGRFTIFVPSVPTPPAGAIYILSRERVHPLNVPFTKAVQAISPRSRSSMGRRPAPPSP
jgi:hypothetical protein